MTTLADELLGKVLDSALVHYITKEALLSEEAQSRLGPGVRKHQVIGHLRVLKCGRVEPVWVWVTAHWRGDASLGVVLRERHVQTAA